ncbi:MAG: hypothetical protein R2705_23390 [Ilumatobacteraceae bacterium]
MSAGLDQERLRVVPLGADLPPRDPAEAERVRAAYRLPDRFVLFVGTLEPRKNLPRLAQAVMLAEVGPLVVVGPVGWGPDFPEATRSTCWGSCQSPTLVHAVRRRRGRRLPEPPGGIRAPGPRGHGDGNPGGHDSRHGDRGDRGGTAVLVDPHDPADIARGLRGRSPSTPPRWKPRSATPAPVRGPARRP